MKLTVVIRQIILTFLSLVRTLCNFDFVSFILYNYCLYNCLSICIFVVPFYSVLRGFSFFLVVFLNVAVMHFFLLLFKAL